MSDKKGLWFDGSRLDVTLALSQKELQKLGEKRATNAAEKERDKRNLYLAREGVIAPNSEVAASLTKTELAKRTASYSARKSKLGNPYFFVSKTRLSVRELPVTVNEKELKKIFLANSGRGAKIKQVKLMRSKERFTSDGLGRSMGYGFVEFSDHSSALAALRAVNNNPEIFGPRKRPLVEFALEDSRVLKRREQKKQKQNSLSRNATSLVDCLTKKEDNTTDKPNKGDYGKKLSKRVDWQLKWKERRLKQKDRGKPTGKKKAGKPRETNQKEIRIFRRTATRNASIGKHKSKHQHTYEEKGNRSFRERRKRKEEFFDGKLERKPRRKRRKLAAEESQKEKEFATMVKNYKAKLFSRNEDTRWFE